MGYIQKLPSKICVSILQDERINIAVLNKAEVFFMFLGNMEDSSDNMLDDPHGFYIPKCNFGIFNFIWTIPEYQSHLGKLYNIWENYLVEKMGWTDEKAREKLADAKKASLFTEMQAWHEEKTGNVLPVYNAEFMSYLFEKCKNRFGNSTFELKESLENRWEEIGKKISDYMIEFMDQIYEILKEQDDFYENTKRQGEKIEHLAEIFGSCPVIKYIRDGNPLIPPEIVIRLDQSDAVKEARERTD